MSPVAGSALAGGGWAVTAAVCAAGAWWLSRPRSVAQRARVVAGRGGGAAEPRSVGGAARLRALALGEGARRLLAGQRRPGAEWWVLVAGAAVAVLGVSPLPIAAALAAVPLVRRARRAACRRRERAVRADAVIALCGALAGEVRAGRQPGEALPVAVHADGTGVLAGALAPAVAAARFGGDVAAALGGASRSPGAEGLGGLAACWRVAVDRGAGLADGLERLDAALRAERDRRADLRSQLAGARATTVMLAGLPALGLLLGTALGADPLRILLHTGPGLACLAVGGLLETAGVRWALWIVRGAEEGP
ncbi:type II secretion system F family protein [Streptomyces sp. NPDC002644]